MARSHDDHNDKGKYYKHSEIKGTIVTNKTVSTTTTVAEVSSEHNIHKYIPTAQIAGTTDLLLLLLVFYVISVKHLSQLLKRWDCQQLNSHANQ